MMARIPLICLLHALTLLAWLLSIPAQAQQAPMPDWPQAQGIDTPQRWSHWLRHNGHLDDSPADRQGWFWFTPQEQARQRLALAEDLTRLRRHLRTPERWPVLAWLQTHAATGRMPLPVADPTWLQVLPHTDPLLAPGDRLLPLPLQAPVSVITAEGDHCLLPHTPAASLGDHLRACALPVPDRLWVVQSSGQVQSVSLTHWRPQPQPGLTHGAVLWSGWPDDAWTEDTDAATREQLHTRVAQWLGRWPHALGAVPALTERRPDTVAVRPASPTEAWLGLQDSQFSPRPTASNWGVTGLVQTPTARMRSSGHMVASYQHTSPYSWLNLMLQPFDGLEAGFRYMDISNRLYGPESFSGSQSYKDKSMEFKARLLRETANLPEVALGLRDLGGTGLFSGEYLVASKRWGRLDASLGLGWGYVGNRGNLGNPLSILGDKMRTRPQNRDQWGAVNASRYFRGPTSLFGGVEYQSAWGPIFKLEYDGNDYRREPFSNAQTVRTPFNIGVVHRLSRHIDLHASLERGNTLGIGLSFHLDLATLNMPKMFDPPASAWQAVPPAAAARTDWEATRRDLQQQTQWRVQSIARDGDTLRLQVADSETGYIDPRLERVMARLHNDTPSDIARVQVVHQGGGGTTLVDTIDRQRWTQRHLQPARSADTPAAFDTTHTVNVLANVPASAPHSGPASTVLAQAEPVQTQFKPGLSWQQNLGGPNGFLLYQLGATLDGQMHLPGQTEIKGQARLSLLSNFDQYTFEGFSSLPRVRTHLREYQTQQGITLPRLYAAKTERLSQNVSAAVYGGLLEEMFAGYGSELLYRRPGTDWAVGLDLNHVQQRAFRQDFGLRDYRVNTGHLSFYTPLPWHQLHATLSAGQYLAGDRGVTISLARQFDNGVSMGAFATKTNVSAAQFGEGSFNKGIFIQIPFDALMPWSSPIQARMEWVPLTRDGGAMLNRPLQLYQQTMLMSPARRAQKPASE